MQPSMLINCLKMQHSSSGPGLESLRRISLFILTNGLVALDRVFISVGDRSLWDIKCHFHFARIKRFSLRIYRSDRGTFCMVSSILYLVPLVLQVKYI